jgi:HK97 family phage major capsid protein
MSVPFAACPAKVAQRRLAVNRRGFENRVSWIPDPVRGDGLVWVKRFNEEKEMIEVKADALEASFEALETQDEDVAALKAEMAALKMRVDAQALAGARPALSGAKSEASPFVERYLRKGLEAGVELKALSGASDAAGGYAMPEELDQQIDRTLTTISPIRAIANVVRVGSAGYRKLVTTGGTPSGWVGETDGRPETDTPDFLEIAPPFGDLYANPAASQTMLDDAAFDVEAWLASEIAVEFARAEGAAFVSGTGVNQPKGFLAAANSEEADGVRAFGTLQYLKSGAAGAFPASDPQDKLIDLVQKLRAPYRQGAVFVMNSSTAARIRKFKTDDGAFLWQPGLVSGQPDTLLGYPVVEAENMPDIAANALAVAFGNFKAGYLIAERAETQILRDPFTNKPFVHFYATKRIGGQVMNSEAIKLLKFAA